MLSTRRAMDPDYPYRLYNQHFGMGLTDEDLPTMLPMSFPPLWGIRHPYSMLARMGRDAGLAEVKCTKDKYQVKMDVHQFSPEELTVKGVDRYLIVEGKHEERPDEHGYISRSFCRRYLLPDDINADDLDDKVTCNLTSDGVLCITLPRPPAIKEGAREKILPITQIGAPAIAAGGATAGCKK